MLVATYDKTRQLPMRLTLEPEGKYYKVNLGLLESLLNVYLNILMG